MTLPVDPLALLVPWVAFALDVRAVADLPSDLQEQVKVKPVVQLFHVNGADDLPTLAELTIDVDYYGPRDIANPDQARATLSALARRGHRAFRYDLPNRTLAVPGQQAVIYTVRTQTMPRPDGSYGDPNVARYLSTYTIGFKARPQAA